MDNTINNDIIEKAICKHVAIYKSIGMLPPIETKDLWEEKNSIEHQKNYENKNVSEINDTTKDTKMPLMPKDWKDTTNKWIRNCPKCNKEISYNNLKQFKKACRHNFKCKSCAAGSYTRKRKIKPIGPFKRNCPKCNIEIIYKDLRRYNRACKNLNKCQSCVQTGVVRKVKTPVTYIRNCPDCNKELIYKYKCTFANSNKINSRCVSCSTKYRLIKRGYNKSKIRSCPQCKSTLTYKCVGHCTTAEKKNKVCRRCCNENRKQSILENLKGKHTWANYNPISCKYFDDLNIKNKWNLQHALNGGEVRILNYFVDAYDKERNIVVEYDETYHYTRQGTLKQKDVLRQQRIITHLGCRFFRYNERTKELYEIKTSVTN